MEDEIQAKLLQKEEGDLKGRIWDESKKIWRVALPGIISRVCAFGTIVVTQSFIGHISDVDLAGYALVQTLSVRFVNGILLGMSSATETLCGQAFGAGQHHMMGIYLQRSWIVDLITLTILLPIFIFATHIFKLLGEDFVVANSGGYISLWFIPFVYNFVFSLTIQMYLQAQLKNMVIACLSIFQFGIHIPLSSLLVHKLNLGVAGAMIALSISSWFLVIGEFVYIFGGWCPYSWKGFTVAAFKDLFPVVKLSISSGVMVSLELWYYALLVLLAGYMVDAKVAISAFSICLNINTWELMISLGFLGAACVRVANELGRGNVKAAKLSIKVLLGTCMAIGVLFFVLCLIFRRKFAYFFTDDVRVADAVSDLSLLLSFSLLLNSIYPVLSGVAVGAGMQGSVAMVNLVCFYMIGIPMGALLGYLTNLQVKGIWMGMIGGVVTQTVAIIYMIWTTNWDDQSHVFNYNSTAVFSKLLDGALDAHCCRPSVSSIFRCCCCSDDHRRRCCCCCKPHSVAANPRLFLWFQCYLLSTSLIMELEDWAASSGGSSDSEVTSPDSDNEDHCYASGDLPKLQFRKGGSKARWKEELGMAEVISNKGRLWITTGIMRGGKLYSFLEDTLFLAEIGALHLLDDMDNCIPLEDIYKKVAKGVGGASWESFEVYKHLKSLGYIIKRHGVCWSMKHVKSVTASVEDESENGSEERGSITEITESFSTMQINEAKPVFDVYPPNSKFRKSSPGKPMFVLCINSGNPPTKKQIEDLEGQCEGIPLKFCYVEHGRVSFFSFNEIELPVLP
ncbi:hypothetical protein L1987_28953 [Smallanthus sonchifolius]|uniref:Uncharacterized protein n=1 Tax=Smallanthus sonchifolius TaxID=185202 RepID=A0ACB9HYP3_9ASTR|nr:hypothetical protein L1987_28953 [Smallanthus sonchifolius]